MSGTERMENPNAPMVRPIPACISNGAACAGLIAECEARTEEIAANESLRTEIERLRAAFDAAIHLINALRECRAPQTTREANAADEAEAAFEAALVPLRDNGQDARSTKEPK